MLDPCIKSLHRDPDVGSLYRQEACSLGNNIRVSLGYGRVKLRNIMLGLSVCG